MAALFCGSAIPYDSFPSRLHEMDIVIASSAAPGYVLTREMVRRAIEARRNQPMFLIDIAVPRNIEPDVNKLEHAFLYDMDDLQRLAARNMQARRGVADQAEAIVTEEVLRLQARLRARAVVPAIVGLQEQLEAVRRDTLERFRPKLGPADGGARASGRSVDPWNHQQDCAWPHCRDATPGNGTGCRRRQRERSGDERGATNVPFG